MKNNNDDDYRYGIAAFILIVLSVMFTFAYIAYQIIKFCFSV